MKAYLTTINEKTTGLCREQLERFGFDVVMLDKKEPWFDKYKRFIMMANEDCLRIDADVIVNKNIEKVKTSTFKDFQDRKYLMVEFNGWDFYKNDVGVIGCNFYSAECLEILRKNIGKIQEARPETSAWRMSEIISRTLNSKIVVGIHGIGQDLETFKRAVENKTARGQMDQYDFDLANKITKLCA